MKLHNQCQCNYKLLIEDKRKTSPNKFKNERTQLLYQFNFIQTKRQQEELQTLNKSLFTKLPENEPNVTLSQLSSRSPFRSRVERVINDLKNKSVVNSPLIINSKQFTIKQTRKPYIKKRFQTTMERSLNYDKQRCISNIRKPDYCGQRLQTFCSWSQKSSKEMLRQQF